MIKIGLIGTQSMHAQAFAQACNVPDEEGNYLFPDVRVTAVYSVDDTLEHRDLTMEKGRIPLAASSLGELMGQCDAFMVLQRRGGEHLKYAAEIIKHGAPVFIDKPVCCTMEDADLLQQLAQQYDAVICGGSALKYNRQILQLKQAMQDRTFGPVRGGTVNHSADMDSPYDGIFFYLPHAVEMMLELFGYDPVSVRTMCLSHNHFTVCVKYSAYLVNLAINGSTPCLAVAYGRESQAVTVDDRDAFRVCMAHFVDAIRAGKPTKDTGMLTRHVAVILAIRKALETNTEVTIER